MQRRGGRRTAESGVLGDENVMLLGAVVGLAENMCLALWEELVQIRHLGVEARVRKTLLIGVEEARVREDDARWRGSHRISNLEYTWHDVQQGRGPARLDH